MKTIRYCTEFGLWGLMDSFGDIILKPKYKFIESFSEGIAAVQNNKDSWGYVNEFGKEIILMRNKVANPFIDGCTIVKWENNIFQIINRDGDLVFSEGSSPIYQFEELKRISKNIICFGYSYYTSGGDTLTGT